MLDHLNRRRRNHEQEAVPKMSAQRGRHQRIVYVARNDGTDMRVSKECNSLLRAGYEVHFVGWGKRVDGEWPDPMPDVPKHVFRSRGSGSVGMKILQFPRFALHVAKAIHELRPEIVHGVNEEVGLLVVALQRFYGYKSICDIFDSVALVWGGSGFPVESMARLVTKTVHRGSDVLIVTDETRKMRLGVYEKKAWTVWNYPVDIGADAAFDMPNADGPVRLYVAGSLSAGRGLESVLRLIQCRDDVEVVSAGWLYDDVARTFVEHPKVDYHGVITPDDSLRLAVSCHAIVALYEPRNQNNLLASPNKVYDALCVGRPAIINREAQISKWVAENNVGHVVRYGEVDDLSAVIDELRQNRISMHDFVAAMRRFYETGYSWEVAERELLAAYAACA